MQKHVNLVDLVNSFPTNIYLQKSASIQPRTSHLIFIILAASRNLIFTERSSPGYFAEVARRRAAVLYPGDFNAVGVRAAGQRASEPRSAGYVELRRSGKLDRARSRLHRSQILQVNMRWNSYLFRKLSPRSTKCTSLHRFGIESPKTRKNMGKTRAWPRQHLEEITRRSP